MYTKESKARRDALAELVREAFAGKYKKTKKFDNEVYYLLGYLSDPKLAQDQANFIRKTFPCFVRLVSYEKVNDWGTEIWVRRKRNALPEKRAMIMR